MLDIYRNLHNETEDSNKWQGLKDEIEKLDKKIDEEVYKLYGLTPEEIAIMEEGLK
ncbi:MAG: restriction endonuclease [Candidatus Daviesbacteria bacterium]|nr:restriction endonuclease [Candidatus Daviesbacteria bacterium]